MSWTGIIWKPPPPQLKTPSNLLSGTSLMDQAPAAENGLRVNEMEENTYIDAKQRLTYLHTVLCLASFILRPQLPPCNVFQTCMQFAVVVFACEAVWLLNFAHCKTSVDRHGILPFGVISWWMQYAITSLAFAVAAYVPLIHGMGVRRGSNVASMVAAFAAASAYAFVCRYIRAVNSEP